MVACNRYQRSVGIHTSIHLICSCQRTVASSIDKLCGKVAERVETRWVEDIASRWSTSNGFQHIEVDERRLSHGQHLDDRLTFILESDRLGDRLISRNVSVAVRDKNHHITSVMAYSLIHLYTTQHYVVLLINARLLIL